MNIPIQYWEEPDKQQTATMGVADDIDNQFGRYFDMEKQRNADKEVDRMQQELSAINDQYRDIAYGVWVLAYEDNSDRHYKEVLEQLNELKNVARNAINAKYQHRG